MAEAEVKSLKVPVWLDVDTGNDVRYNIFIYSIVTYINIL
jgi:hypothetical protein